MPHPRPVAAVLAALLLLLSACAQPSGTPSAEGVATSPNPTVLELSDTGDPLPPGRYTRAGFMPRITLSVTEDGWYAVQLYDGFFDIQQDVGSPDVIAVQFGRPSSVFGEGGGSVAVATAEEAAEVLRGHPALTVLDESESLMDGHAGVALEVEHAGASASNVSIMVVPPGPLSIAPDRRLWVAFLDTDEGLLAVMVGGPAAGWEEALATAEPVLDLVTID